MNVGGDTYSTDMGFGEAQAIYKVLESPFKCNQGTGFQLVFQYTHVNIH